MAKGDRELISFRSRRSDLWTQINGPIEPGYSACGGSCINGVGNPRFHAGFWRAGCITKGARPVRQEGMRNPRWSTAARRACPTHLVVPVKQTVTDRASFGHVELFQEYRKPLRSK